MCVAQEIEKKPGLKKQGRKDDGVYRIVKGLPSIKDFKRLYRAGRRQGAEAE